MAEKKQQIKQIELIDMDAVKNLSFANVNGTVYFGKITPSEDGKSVKVENAIEVEAEHETTEEILKAWLTANNSGTLRNPKIGGQIAFNIEDMNETQLLEAESLVLTINNKLKYSFTNLANTIIAEA